MSISRVKHTRITILKERESESGPVIYWMSRDQREKDNWALLYAQELALSRGEPLAAVFTLAPGFLGATLRQYDFMLKGLKETAACLKSKNIPFIVLTGEPSGKLAAFTRKNRVSTVVTDFDPIKVKSAWKRSLMKRIKASLIEIDTHNIVPCRLVSNKQEWGAYTIRPKIKRLIDEYLTEIPPIEKHPYVWKGSHSKFDLSRTLKKMKIDRSVEPVDRVDSGPKAGLKALKGFLRDGLASYDDARNDPNKNGQSNLSPYLHFGQLSAQRVALEVQRSDASKKAKETFLEELIVRRELSDNFCLYNKNYDSTEAFPSWAEKTLKQHARDKREYIYSASQLEKGITHDALWNAAQLEMVRTGKMHGYMRMYWAKKILEWTPSPERAMRRAIYLNDKYELDGRDPNGYAGIAWSIGGVHDRAWGERPVFGKIRYMSEGGCRGKFDADEYIRRNCRK